MALCGLRLCVRQGAEFFLGKADEKTTAFLKLISDMDAFCDAKGLDQSLPKHVADFFALLLTFRTNLYLVYQIQSFGN